MLLPAGALFREGKDWKTFVMKNGHAVATTLSVGHTDGRMTEILSGVAEGTQVLLHPPDTVKDGTEVVKRK
jgi:HlyD family secretion protein